VRTLLTLTLLACAGCDTRTATVRVTIPDLDGIETPVPGLQVIFLPYDRDSLVRAFEAKAPTPRPHTKELDSLFREFAAPYREFIRIATVVDRLRRERDSLTQALGTAAAGPRLAAITDSIGRLTPAETAANATLKRTRERLGPAIDRLRSDATKWESDTYRDYQSAVRGLGIRSFANPVADTTDALGWATIALTNGTWWATARSIDPGDPYREWYWNVRIDGDTVALSPRTGRFRPRY